LADIATCAGSLLPAVEPIAGAALALNLAYLNLDRFRYRRDIYKHACKQLESLNGAKNQLDALPNGHVYKFITRLGTMPDPDKKESLGFSASDDSDHSGFWWFVYRYVFEKHQDMAACYVLTGVALVALLLGVASNVGQLEVVTCLFQGWVDTAGFYLLCFSVLAPIALVEIGRRSVRALKRTITKGISDISGLMQTLAKEEAAEANRRIANPGFAIPRPRGALIPPHRPPVA
jgi:hypothetical protein